MNFIPKWTKAIESADKAGIEPTVLEYDPPRSYDDIRIKYINSKFGLNFFHVNTSVVTEAHNWNAGYFRRENKNFCKICNGIDKNDAYFAVITPGAFKKFKNNLLTHFESFHPKLLYNAKS